MGNEEFLRICNAKVCDYFNEHADKTDGKRLTVQDVTPGTLETAFSTRALQAAQLMPFTLNCSIFEFASFCCLSVYGH